MTLLEERFDLRISAIATPTRCTLTADDPSAGPAFQIERVAHRTPTAVAAVVATIPRNAAPPTVGLGEFGKVLDVFLAHSFLIEEEIRCHVGVNRQLEVGDNIIETCPVCGEILASDNVPGPALITAPIELRHELEAFVIFIQHVWFWHVASPFTRNNAWR
jgi:hypothetical protein